jgi:hypothetical protein
MTRFITALAIALVISGATLNGQSAGTQKPGTEVLSPQAQQKAKNLIEDVTTVGCIRLWRPAPEDPKQMPPDRQPGIAGIYLLTPLASMANSLIDIPTYVLTPSATHNFWQNVDRKVEITGTSQAAPLPPTVQETVSVPARPENKPSIQSMPRLTVRTLKMVGDSCP